MSLKLYKVNIETEMYVLAETSELAEEVARQCAEDEYPEVTSREIKALRDVDSHWQKSLPYGTNEEVTVKEWWDKNHRT